MSSSIYSSDGFCKECSATTSEDHKSFCEYYAPPAEAPAGDLPDSFFDIHPNLRRVADRADSINANRTASLYHVFARIAASRTPLTKSEGVPGLGTDLSLNYFVGVVGESGQGKGKAETVGASLIKDNEGVMVAMPGSAAGLASTFAPKIETGPSGIETVTPAANHGMFSYFDEGRTFFQTAGRSGEPLIAVLNTAFDGSEMSTILKSESRTVKADTYSLGMVISLQEVLVQDLVRSNDIGFLQRFMFAPAYRTKPAYKAGGWRDHKPMETTPIKLELMRGRIPLEDDAKDLMYEFFMKDTDEAERLRTGNNSQSTKLLQKTGTLLAILTEADKVTGSHIDYAELVLQTSREFRDSLITRTTMSPAERLITAATVLVECLQDHGAMKGRALRRKCWSKPRKGYEDLKFSEIVAYAVDNGLIVDDNGLLSSVR